MLLMFHGSNAAIKGIGNSFNGKITNSIFATKILRQTEKNNRFLICFSLINCTVVRRMFFKKTTDLLSNAPSARPIALMTKRNCTPEGSVKNSSDQSICTLSIWRYSYHVLFPFVTLLAYPFNQHLKETPIGPTRCWRGSWKITCKYWLMSARQEASWSLYSSGSSAGLWTGLWPLLAWKNS